MSADDLWEFGLADYALAWDPRTAHRSTLRALTAEFAPTSTRVPVDELDDEANVERPTAWFANQWSGRAAAFNRHWTRSAPRSPSGSTRAG